MSVNTKPFFLPLLKKEQLTDDTWSFYFKRTGDERDFKPGQYYEMKLNIPDPDERGDSRVFTICSSPTQEEYVMFTTRILQSSFKRALVDLEIGKEVQFDGPWDDLEVNLENPAQKVFIAGGIGVTPFHSIVKFCIDMNLQIPLILFVSWSERKQVIFHDFFRSAEQSLAHLKYIPTITKEGDLKDWDGQRGRINQSVIERHVVNTPDTTYYIVGPEGFVKGMEHILFEIKVAQERIISEHFPGY